MKDRDVKRIRKELAEYILKQADRRFKVKEATSHEPDGDDGECFSVNVEFKDDQDTEWTLSYIYIEGLPPDVENGPSPDDIPSEHYEISTIQNGTELSYYGRTLKEVFNNFFTTLPSTDPIL